VTERDAARLEALVSPARKLAVRQAPTKPSERFDTGAQLFKSATTNAWLPSLGQAMAEAGPRACAVNESAFAWPEELIGLTQVSYRADDASRVTWLAGIEFVNKKPYVAVLIQYQRET
jgi:hypothetical protein